MCNIWNKHKYFLVYKFIRNGEIMDKDDLFNEFISNLRKEVKNKEFIDSLEILLKNNKFTKNNYIKLIEEVYHE